MIYNFLRKKKAENYITFISDGAFSLAITKNWGGTIEYSDDKKTWEEWDGTELETLPQPNSGRNYALYLRGTGNTKISGNSTSYAMTITGSAVRCFGNIEMLLDYKTAAKGDHPAMDQYAFAYLFYGCTALITPPALPVVTLTPYCYYYMFANSEITTAPDLPATTMQSGCYRDMFYGCTAIKTVPALPALTLESQCYYDMFRGCTALVTLPALYAVTIPSGAYYQMFYQCTNIQLATASDTTYVNAYRVPMSGTGTLLDYTATRYMFRSTGGSYSATPSINTTYYTANEIVYPTETENEAAIMTLSEEWPEEIIETPFVPEEDRETESEEDNTSVD